MRNLIALIFMGLMLMLDARAATSGYEL